MMESIEFLISLLFVFGLYCSAGGCHRWCMLFLRAAAAGEETGSYKKITVGINR